MEHQENRCNCNPALTMHEAGCPRDALKRERDRYRAALESIKDSYQLLWEIGCFNLGLTRLKSIVEKALDE